ncbi:MAG: MFS transporter [Anaerolineales bacterium]|nr:MFS transporter [Anaerolineales bacterium]HEY61998.1 MFS transporter [Anaerolineae bacterium]
MAGNTVAKTKNLTKEYISRLRKFQPNARLYLVNVLISGMAMGVYRLLLNFYVLSLGFDEALLGVLITISSLTALFLALPMGFVSDFIGRKRSLIVGGILIGLSIFGMILFPSRWMFYAMSVLSGVGQSLWSITMAPFLMENSGEEERTYLFSFGSGLQMLSAFVGNWIGGYLPSWLGGLQGVSSTDSSAYSSALFLVGTTFALGLIPLMLIHVHKEGKKKSTAFAPLEYAKKHPKLLNKLILPILITSIGAGLVMPFMNVFFRVVHNQSDQVIGTIFAWGSLAMGLGLLIAPPLADRIGKIQLVVISQALSVPFLILLGFSPWFWLSAGAYYVRLALMNMSGPIYQTFVMESVEPSARATVASLVSMSWNFGWAFSPIVSGYLQVNYGFGLPFVGTITLYAVAIVLYWAFFWRDKPMKPEKTTLPVID